MITKTCAKYTLQIITNPDGYGTDRNLAKVVVHVNADKNYQQPGCYGNIPLDPCPHFFVVFFYAAVWSGAIFTLNSSQELTRDSKLSTGIYYLSIDDDAVFPYSNRRIREKSNF